MYAVVRENLETLYGAISDGALDVRVPKHARRQLESYLGCGIPCWKGFARFPCRDCAESRIVALTCQGQRDDRPFHPQPRRAFARIHGRTLAARLAEPRQHIQVVAGPRQVGKTTLVLQALRRFGERARYASADEPTLRDRAWLVAQWDALRKRLPTAHELVYDNYNFFVIGYSPTERPSDAVVSITGGANGVGLCFVRGASLPDPERILLGSGNQTRFVRIDSVAVLARREVQALLAVAVAQSKAPFRAAGRGRLIIRSVSATQRPRRKTGR